MVTARRVSGCPGPVWLNQAGAESEPTDFHKNCRLAIGLGYPQGFTFGVAQADYRGFAHLEAGAVGMEQGNYYFQGTW